LGKNRGRSREEGGGGVEEKEGETVHSFPSLT